MSRLLRTLLFIFCIATPTLPVKAQEAPGEAAPGEMHLSLAECIEIALSNNSQIVQNRYAREIAEAQIDNNRNAFLPTINSSYGINRSITGPREGAIFDPVTQTIVTTLGEDRVSGSQSVSTNLGIQLYDPADFANLSASKKGAKAAELDLSNSRQQIAFQVKQQYFNLLQSIKQFELAQEQVNVSEESFRRNETLYEIGSAAISDVFSAKSQLERDRVNLITRENAVAVARLNLGFTLGLGTDVNIHPTEEEFEIAPASLTYEEALNRALEGHPDLVARKFRMLQSKDQLRATRYGVRFPRVSANVGYSWRLNQGENFSGLEDLFVKNYSYSAGISVSLPIFNGLSTENNVKIRKLQYLQSQAQLDQAKRQKALDIRQAFLNLERLRRSIAANEAAVQAAEEDFRLQDQRYNLGGGTFLERQQAQLNLFNARNQLIQDQYNYQIELARLEQAVGISPVQTGDE